MRLYVAPLMPMLPLSETPPPPPRASLFGPLAKVGLAFGLVALLAKALESESAHDRGVLDVAERLERRGCRDVRADHVGGPRPKLLGGRRPDVTAVCGELFIVREVETDRSVSTSHSRRQHLDLTRWARPRRWASYARVVVPG